MAFRDARLANEQLSKVLAEADIPNLQGQIDVDATNRKGWGSFGEVFVGQYNGIVSRITCISAAGIELMSEFASTERLCQNPERNPLHRRSPMGKIPSGTPIGSPTLGSSERPTDRDSNVR